MKFTTKVAWLVVLAGMAASPALHAQRKLLPGQVSRLTTINVDGTGARVVYQTADLIEAPNWTPDGRWLVYNGGGRMWRIRADGSGGPEPIETGSVKTANNDHVISPDGKMLYLSASGHLYAVPIAGGEPRRVSNEQPPARKFRYYLHGISPDGKTLAYVGAETLPDGRQRLDVYTIPAAGGPDSRLTDTPEADDGPEYTPDGRWIYFNAEVRGAAPGHAQIFRMRPDGGGVEQLTADERVNWFPHVSPDGRWIVFISFPAGTVGHPANKDVILRRMRPGGSEVADVVAFFGGQGTINVNSWAPDSRRFAYVEYPVNKDGR